MANRILWNTGQSIALAVNWVIQGPYSYKFLTKQAAATLRLNADFFCRVDYAIMVFEVDVDLTATHLDAGAALEASETYYAYICHPLDATLAPAFRLSKNATYPAGGWDADTSRKIGGFDTDGAGEIDADTIWDLRTEELTEWGVIEGTTIGEVTPADGWFTLLGVKTTTGAAYEIKTISELVTVAVGSGAAGVETSGNLAPAGIILGCAFRVTQAPGGGATELDIGITGGDLAALIDGKSCDVLGETGDMAADGQLAYQPINRTAATLTLTTDSNVTVSDMIVRVVVWYAEITAPTS